MNLFCTKLREPFKSKRVIKLITGIDNLNLPQIITMAKAAELSGITYIDTVASTKVVKLLKSFSSLPVCVSSISPLELYNCVIAGADLIEIGNFNFCYQQGIYLTAAEILHLVKEIRSLISDIDICVTIPYYLSLHDQIKLAQDLEFIGINILQTESAFVKNKIIAPCLLNKNIFTSFNSSSLSLLSCHTLSKHVKLPIIASSSINTLSSSLSISMGASGIGIGSIINQQKDLQSMLRYLQILSYSINQTDSSLIPKSSNQSRFFKNHFAHSYIKDNIIT